MRTRIYQSGSEVIREIPPDHLLNMSLDDTPIIERYWVPRLSSGEPGYVRLVDDHHPGTLGRQVCVGLDRLGSTLMATPDNLLTTIRHHHHIEMARKE